MTTPRTISYQYSAEPDALAALLHDPAFLKARSEAAGESNVDVHVRYAGDCVEVTVSRDREMAVPAFASRFVKPTSRVVDRQTWRRVGDRWAVEYSIELGSAPGKVTGRTSVVPAPGGCHYESTFEVTTNVPLIGSKLEALVADRVEESLRANAERSARHLLQDRQRDS